MPVLYQASLRSTTDTNTKWDLAIQNISDQFKRTVIKHEFPHTNGALLEDLGEEARQIKFICYFIGVEGEDSSHEDIPSINKGSSFVEYLRQKNQVYEMMHPFFGVLKGRIQSLSIRQDNSINGLEVEIDFWEQKIAANIQVKSKRGGVSAIRAPIASPKDISILDASKASFKKGIQEQKKDWSDSLVEKFGVTAQDFLNQKMEEGKSFQEQLTNQASPFTDYVRGVDTQTQRLKELGQAFGKKGRSFLQSAQNLGQEANNAKEQAEGYYDQAKGLQKQAKSQVNEIINFVENIDFGQDFAGSVLKSVSQTAGRVIQEHSHLMEKPAQFIDFVLNSLKLQEELFVGTNLEETVEVQNARMVALATASSYELEEKSRDNVRQLEDSSSFDVEGRFVESNVLTSSLTTTKELEQSLSQVRQKLQVAVSLSKSNRGLKTMAIQISDHVRTRKVEVERVKVISVKPNTPLFVLMRNQSLSYNISERIIAMNDIENPLFVNPSFGNHNPTGSEVKVYVRDS